jgi:hypothetical protein
MALDSLKDTLELLHIIREISWIAYADNRTVEEMKKDFHTILCLTRDIGNEPVPTETLDKYRKLLMK